MMNRWYIADRAPHMPVGKVAYPEALQVCLGPTMGKIQTLIPIGFNGERLV